MSRFSRLHLMQLVAQHPFVSRLGWIKQLDVQQRPPSSLCHCLCPIGKCPHSRMKMSARWPWLQNMRSVPFCNSFPARRGHYQTETRYQTLRNILHSGRRLSSAPPSLPAENQSTSRATQRPQRSSARAKHRSCADSQRAAEGRTVQRESPTLRAENSSLLRKFIKWDL